MSLHETYDPENIFAKIIKGEIPSAKVYEDDRHLAFMDAFPQSEGHTLVIAKDVSSVNLLDMPSDRLGELIVTTQKVADALVKALTPDGFRIVQFNGAPAGQSVYHLHFHIIPVWEGKALGQHGEGMADAGALQALAEKISAQL